MKVYIHDAVVLRSAIIMMASMLSVIVSVGQMNSEAAMPKQQKKHVENMCLAVLVFKDQVSCFDDECLTAGGSSGGLKCMLLRWILAWPEVSRY